jgi:hypothetical protein
MKTLKITTLSLALAALCAPLQANASKGSCAAGLTTNAVQFESAIKYDDLQSKANPAVHVLINGKPAKMMLATGSNMNSLWDESFLDEKPSPHPERLKAIVGSADARTVKATLADGHGNALRQEFLVTADSALAQDGFAGMLSPQAVAGLNAVVIDFEKNCFFTSPPFAIKADNSLQVGQGKTIPNPHDEMAISVELDGRKIPVIVGSGAPVTFIQESLVASNPKGPQPSRFMDIFKAEIPQAEHMRLVDLKINGQNFKSLPVVPRLAKVEEGVLNFGTIGMDVLKERVIYYHGAEQEFTLLTRQQVAKNTAHAHRVSRIE